MRARRRRRDHARSGLTPEAEFSITTSRSSGVPLSQISNLPGVSLARKDAKTQAVKHNHKSMPRPSPPRLAPVLLDQGFIQPGEVSLDGDYRPCASRKARKGRRPNDHHISSRPRDTSSPDCFLPRDTCECIRLRIITFFFVYIDYGSLRLWGRFSRREGLRILHTTRLPNQYACGV